MCLVSFILICTCTYTLNVFTSLFHFKLKYIPITLCFVPGQKARVEAGRERRFNEDSDGSSIYSAHGDTTTVLSKTTDDLILFSGLSLAKKKKATWTA